MKKIPCKDVGDNDGFFEFVTAPTVSSEEIIQSLIDTHKKATSSDCENSCDFITAWETAIRQLKTGKLYGV